MLPYLSGSTQQYLSDLQNMNSELNTLSQQLSSGLRVSSVADDPLAVPQIMELQAQIGRLQQTKTNLTNLQPELQTGDAALQQAMTNVESAISIASQASNSLTTPGSMTALATQVQGIMANLVKLSNTSSNGRYIFSGDLDQQPLYALDASQPTGVQQLATATSTRGITDSTGTQIWLSKTSSEIFDHRNPDTTPATDNVFAAVNSLLTALQAGSSSGALTAISNLQAAHDHLNQELGYYGIGENRVTDTLNSEAQTLVHAQTNLSGLRDVDMATAAVQMNQLQVQQQAALSSRAKVGGLNLFNFLA
jgi:flagellar hook-associated protein 3 FlgL